MSKVLIISLGNRDIQLKEKIEGIEPYLNKKDSSLLDKRLFREGSKKLFKKIDENEEILSKVEIPIIKPLIEKLKIREYESIILLATDQKDASKNYRDQDTIYEAKIVEKILKKRYGLKEGKIRREIIDFNVNNLERLMKRILRILIDNEDKEIYLELSGGIPQFRTPIEIPLSWFDNIKGYYSVKERGEVTDIKEILTGFQSLLKNKDLVKESIEKFDYANALYLLKKLPKKQRIISLIKIGIRKRNFEYEPANIKKRFLEEGKKYTYLVRVPRKKSDLEEEKEEYKNKILELLDYLETEVEAKRWNSFLAKLFRLSDALGLYLFTELYGKKDEELFKNILKEEEIKGKGEINRIKEILGEDYKKANEAFTKNKEKNINIKKECDENELKIKVSAVFFYEIFKAKKEFEKYTQIIEGMIKGKNHNSRTLRSLRNKGINAHSFKPATEEEIRTAVSDVKDYYSKLRKNVYDLLKENYKKNKYYVLNEAITKELDKEIKDLLR